MTSFAVVTGQLLAEQLLFGGTSGAAFSKAMSKGKGYRGQVTSGIMNGYIFCLKLPEEDEKDEDDEKT